MSYLNEIRELAGLPTRSKLNESYDDDDDEDPDVRVALKDKKQAEFEKKSAAQRKADEAKVKQVEAEAAKKKAANKQDEPKEQSKVESKPEEKKPEEAKSKADEADATEKKSRAREGSKRNECAKHMAANPGIKLKDFKAWAHEKFGMGAHHATTYYYSLGGGSRRAVKTEVSECWMIHHPHYTNYVLAENAQTRRYAWMDISSDETMVPVICETNEQANAIATHLKDFNGQHSNVVQFVFE